MNSAEWIVTGLETKLGSPDKQVWIEQDDKFTSVRFGGKEFPADSREANLLGAKSCPSCSSAGEPVPASFVFCPNCGGAIGAQNSGPSLALCHWPSFGASGWPESPERLASFDDRTEISIPGGDWGFITAGDPAFLIAFDHENGQIVRYDGKNHWAPVCRGPAAPLQPWQRSLIPSPLGVFFSTEHQGLGFLPTPFVPGVKIAASCKCSSQPVAGPGIVNNCVFVPTMTGDGIRIVGCPLTVSPARDPNGWILADVEDTSDGGAESFGAPYTNDAGDLFWSGEKTYMVITNSDDFKPRRVPWRKGFEAFPRCRPFRWRRGGSAWQLGQYTAPGSAESQFAFHLVSLSTTRQEVHMVDGPHLAYGQGTFRGDKRYNEPWADFITDYDPASDNNIYIPIATFGEGEGARYIVAVMEGREKLSDLLSEKGVPATDVRIYLLGRLQGSTEDMRAAYQVQNLHDISATVTANRLLIYGRCENRLISWRIST